MKERRGGEVSWCGTGGVVLKGGGREPYGRKGGSGGETVLALRRAEGVGRKCGTEDGGWVRRLEVGGLGRGRA